MEHKFFSATSSWTYFSIAILVI